MERFPGYTLSTLLEEDTELLQLVKIHALAHPQDPAASVDPTDGGW